MILKNARKLSKNSFTTLKLAAVKTDGPALFVKEIRKSLRTFRVPLMKQFPVQVVYLMLRGMRCFRWSSIHSVDSLK